MRAHIIEDNTVINTIEVESIDFMPNLIEATTGGIGWRYENGELLPPIIVEPEQPVPVSVSRRQGRLALLSKELLDDVEATIAGIEDPVQHRAAQIEYEADTWDRSNAFLQTMWTNLGGDAAGLDDLFRLAVTL